MKINNKQVKIKKLPIGKYAELLEGIENLPEEINKLDSISEENFLAAIPKMIRAALPDLIHIAHIGSGVPEDELKNEYGLADFVKLYKEILRVNEIGEVKKVIGPILGNLSVSRSGSGK